MSDDEIQPNLNPPADGNVRVLADMEQDLLGPTLLLSLLRCNSG